MAVTAAAGDHIVFLARAGEHSARGVPVHVGQRVPLLPPLGSVFVAWGEADDWLARSGHPEMLHAVLEGVRARGYSVGLETGGPRGLAHALDDLAAHPTDDQLRGMVDGYVTALLRGEYQLREAAPSRTCDVTMIAAPIFGSAGEVVLALTLFGFPGRLKGREIAAYGNRLRDVGLVVTKRSRGRVPSVPVSA